MNIDGTNRRNLFYFDYSTLGHYTFDSIYVLNNRLFIISSDNEYPLFKVIDYEGNGALELVEDKIYENTGMIMISALPNPYNYKKPLIIYIAQDAKDILYINNVYHGSTDYIILKDEKKLYSGSYDKNKEFWSFPIAEH